MRKAVLLLSFTIAAITSHQLKAQKSSYRKEALTGNWKLDAMQDKSGNAFDIGYTSSNDTFPEVLPYLSFGKDSATAYWGSKKWKSAWNLNSNKLTLLIENGREQTYTIVSITGKNLVLNYNLGTEQKAFVAKLFYKKTDLPY